MSWTQPNMMNIPWSFMVIPFATIGKTKCWYDEGGTGSLPPYHPGLSNDDVVPFVGYRHGGNRSGGGGTPLSVYAIEHFSRT